MILYLKYINRKTVFFQLNKIKVTPILKLTLVKRLKIYSKKNRQKHLLKKKISKKYFFCENEKLDYPRFLGDFYYHGTMNLPCIIELTSIRNWVTFCGFFIPELS